MAGHDTDAGSDAPDGSGRWLPVVAAARLAGVTERTMRRRVVAGQVRSRRSGGHTQVWVSGQVPDNAPGSRVDGPTRPATPDGAPVAPDAAVAALERLLRDTLEEKDTAQQAAAMFQERAANLAAEVERLRGQVEDLLALPAHEAPPAPWWRRWGRR